MAVVCKHNVPAQEQVLNSMSKEEALSSNFAYTSLVSSIYSGHEALSKVLISRTGIDLDSQGATGNTPLMFAALWGNDVMAQYLLEAGADYSKVNVKGQFALNIAMNKGNKTIVKLLRTHGASK